MQAGKALGIITFHYHKEQKGPSLLEPKEKGMQTNLEKLLPSLSQQCPVRIRA